MSWKPISDHITPHLDFHYFPHNWDERKHISLVWIFILYLHLKIRCLKMYFMATLWSLWGFILHMIIIHLYNLIFKKNQLRQSNYNCFGSDVHGSVRFSYITFSLFFSISIFSVIWWEHHMPLKLQQFHDSWMEIWSLGSVS